MLGVYRGGGTEQGGGRNWGQKFREKGENEMLWEQMRREFQSFSNFADDKG